MATNVELRKTNSLFVDPSSSLLVRLPDANLCQLLRRELALLSAWIRARQHVITRNCAGEKGRKEKMDE